MSQIKVELQESMGGDRTIAAAAWTSSLALQKKESRSDEDVKRVVNMLADDKHSTPFESVVFRFWIKMPIAIDRQFMTHRLQSSNGMSGRYRTMPTEYFEMPDDVIDISEKSEVLSGALDAYVEVCEIANNHYKRFASYAKLEKDAGVITNDEYKRFREIMRGMLPQHNMTERVTTMNLRAFSNFIKLRNSSYAQPEIRELAQLMLLAVKTANVCPVALEALERNNFII